MRPIANRYSARLPVAPAVALAAPDVSLQADADGTLKVLGSGWRPGQQLVITVGADEFSARADSTGDFEVATGPASYQGDVAIHRPFQTSARPGSLVERYMPNPLAVLFAQSVAIGTVLTLFTGGLASLALAARSPPRARLNPMTVGHAIWLDQLTDAERAQLRPGVAESLDRSPTCSSSAGGLVGLATGAACRRDGFGSLVVVEPDPLGASTSGGAAEPADAHYRVDPPALVDLARGVTPCVDRLVSAGACCSR